MDGVVGRVAVEQVGDAGAGDDDAGMAVARSQHTQAAGFQMEGRCIAAARERVQDDGDGEFASLQAIGGIGADSSGVGRVVKELLNVAGLFPVCGADGDVGGLQATAGGIGLAHGLGAAGQ